MPETVPPADEDPFFEAAVNDLEGADTIRDLVEEVGFLMLFAAEADLDVDRLQFARRQLQAALERELLASRGSFEH